MHIVRTRRHVAPAVEASGASGAQTSLRIALLMFAGYIVLARIEPDLRYTRYVLPAALAGLWLARRVHGESLTLVTAPLAGFAAVALAVIAWSAGNLAVYASFYPRFFEESLFLVAPLGAAMICVSLKRHEGDGPLLALLAILTGDYLWEVGATQLWAVVLEPRLFITDFLQSAAPTESVRAFSFGVLAVTFASRRRYGVAMLCVLLALLGGKRIVLAGLIAAIPILLLAPGLESVRRRVIVAVLATAINVGAAMSLRNLEEWGIADRIQEATMQSADAVLMGRARLFALLADRLPESPVLGVGLGRITHVLSAEGAWLTNTHSDVLKHYMEVGPLMFAGWIGCFYWLSRRRGTLALTVFMNVLFLSDNVSIYFDVMFPFYLAFAYIDHSRAAAPTQRVRRMRPVCSSALQRAA